jgi:single-stranded-DNA-specific exonuclease
VISVMDGIGIGSGRSIVGVDLHRALAHVSGLLTGFGGHKMAVGLSIPDEQIPPFIRALDEVVGSLIPEEQRRFDVDLKISPFDLTPELLDELEQLAPFGEGNPEPVFMIPSMEVVGKKYFEDGQVKLLRCSIDLDFCEASRFLDVAFTPVKMRLNGHSYLYLSLKALAASR